VSIISVHYASRQILLLRLTPKSRGGGKTRCRLHFKK